MNTPELQPETNLKTLEQEAALTKDEITKFQKLPKDEQEKQKQERLAKLLDLQNKLEQAVTDGAKAGNFDEAKRLKEEIEKEIADLEQAIDKTDISIEKLRKIFTPFFYETWENWHVATDEIEKTVIQPIIMDPKKEDYQARRSDKTINKFRFGDFTINPDTQNLDWESLKDKIYITDLPKSLVGQPLYKVAKYVIDTYSDKYRLPGVEYWKFIIENSGDIPDKIKDGKWYFNFGSLVHNFNGSWSVPYVGLSSRWERGAEPLMDEWYSDCFVILLEK